MTLYAVIGLTLLLAPPMLAFMLVYGSLKYPAHPTHRRVDAEGPGIPRGFSSSVQALQRMLYSSGFNMTAALTGAGVSNRRRTLMALFENPRSRDIALFTMELSRSWLMFEGINPQWRPWRWHLTFLTEYPDGTVVQTDNADLIFPGLEDDAWVTLHVPQMANPTRLYELHLAQLRSRKPFSSKSFTTYLDPARFASSVVTRQMYYALSQRHLYHDEMTDFLYPTLWGAWFASLRHLGPMHWVGRFMASREASRLLRQTEVAYPSLHSTMRPSSI